MRPRIAKKKKLSETPITVTIESLAHDGRGITHVDGKVVFIDEALPGEQLDFIYTDSRRDYAEGKIDTLHTRSELRVDPECPHFGICGGCSFQHVKNEAQISIKEGLLTEQFNRIGKIDIPEIWQPLTGPYWGYRRKARMGVKYVAKKDRVLVGFRERRNPFLAEIESCKVMSPSVGEKLMDLSEMIGSLTIKDKIPQIEVAIGDEDCVLAFRVLEPPSAEDKERMRAFGHQHKMHICLQSKGPDSIVPIEGEPEIALTYVLSEQNIKINFKPAMFIQVNYEINKKMVNRVIETLDLNENDNVLDLFCGLGNFTLPMATKAGHVVGVEGDLPLLNHAKENAILNKLDNVEFFVADLNKDVSDQAWAKQKFNKVMLDPSRAGAAKVLHNLKYWKPDLIMYVSCNPSTLARDAAILVNELGYKLLKAGVIDMFPQTGHVESIALFAKA
ncbi:MAG: 23S rRNA (uracil(1939)-C(5))-methyltransferase RlmD [Methylococcales symbiont of Iophon sp. n. MRB-2018]|nr:MAG: 23S rRNA (uracil(1939)-C(5))-methyltransferase RlmD [Methylococcales symbiont of Iophon sp. n. MRB-2018]KAF3979189.1 MAG: 23S rRNA (uracil(1939)-C(5))-methyltransferase RlmD [Methylococcales symbiont of Iophon sp. n. MRB-2018]